MDGTFGDDRYRVMDNVIYYKVRIYLVPGSHLRESIMQAAHDSPLAGLPRFLKIYRVIREHFSWRALKGGVLRDVEECVTCQRNKGELSHLVGLL